MHYCLRILGTAVLAAFASLHAADKASKPDAAAAFTVGCVNCGAFHYGGGRATAEEFAAAWSRLAADWPQDVFFYEDVGKTRKPGNMEAPGLDIRAAARNSPVSCEVVELPRSIESGAGEQKSPRYRALRLVYDIGGKKVAVYGVHLVAEGHLRGPKPAKGELSLSQKLRQIQFRALMDDARKFDHAILTGDFNAQRPHEYDVFTDAGYSLANCSPRYGIKATLRNIPADNIIISQGLSFSDFKVLDGYVLDTDHIPLVAKVVFAPPPLPSVAEFLEKPTAERRKLFKNPDFRRKMLKADYPYGPGLLSRWARVEDIPNLRDVGGIVNRDGRELRRGVFYRSAGWNDNAKTDKKKPESEWKKGKCRLSDAGRRMALEQLKIRTDLDLRTDGECWGMTGSPIGDSVEWRHISFGNYDDFEKDRKWRDAVKPVFATLADPERRPLVFHCIGGADRTGSLAYFIQALCDVDDETLIKDWELTGCYTERVQFMHEPCIDKLIGMLAKYPGKTTPERVRSFLRSCGVTEAEMDSVRSALLGGKMTAAAPSAADRPHDGAVRFGVISDTHVTGPESAPELERALKFFADRGVDAVLHCGDVTDLGYLSQLDVFVASWKRTMPPGTPLIAAFGNRDMSDTSKMTAERKKRDKDLLILSDPDAAMKRLCGWSAKTGVRTMTVRGMPVVAADWKREGELESFMSLRPDLRRAAVRGLVTVQHIHPQGTVFGAGAGSWMADDGRAPCYLKMYPRAWTFSGHSHIPFTTPKCIWRGEFTSVAAGSFYLGPPSASGGREVSVLTMRKDRVELERRDLDTGFCKVEEYPVEDGARAQTRGGAKGGFVFAQWNIGHFAFGKSDTDIAADKAAERAAAYRKAIAEIGADFMGVCELSPAFDKGGGKARDLVFGAFRSFEAGPHRGYQCNALAAASAPLGNVSVKDYGKRCQPTYWIAGETQIGGKRAVIVETHLDLSADERKAQIAALVAEFGAEERIIISGDFNVDTPDEYRPFLDAGFEAANCGRFGALSTHRRRRTAITPAIDNVFVKGFAVRDVRTADDALELSDHRLLVCTLAEP